MRHYEDSSTVATSSSARNRLGRRSAIYWPPCRKGNALIEVSLSEAGKRLEQLIEEATSGEDVVTTTQGGAAVRLVALPRDHSTDVTRSGQTIGHSLDWLIGTWSEEEEREFLQAIEVFEQVDESFWK